MINPKQPLWINFYNLDAENLMEITNLHCLAALPIRIARRVGDEKVLEPKQRYIKEYQLEFRKLVDCYLDETKPHLMQMRKRLKCVTVNEFLNFEQEMVSPFLMELNMLFPVDTSVVLQPDGRFKKNIVITSEVFWVGGCFQSFANAVIDETPILRCEAYQTPRLPACRNIFIDAGKQGPKQRFCSPKCRRRIYKHEKKYHEDKMKRLRGEW